MKTFVITALVTALLASACLQAAPRAFDAAADARVERPGKPTGPIVVETRLAARPAVGVPLKIAIAARVEGDVGRVSIEANASVPNAALVSAPLLVAAETGVYSWELTVVPLAAEAGYLTVIVSGSIDGIAQARSVTISLRSASPAETAAVTIVAGETLIALPVQESP